jgi:hypothetical protein
LSPIVTVGRPAPGSALVADVEVVLVLVVLIAAGVEVVEAGERVLV